MTPKRPINLDLKTIKMPVMAIASIFHRISGLVIFLLLPYILYLFSLTIKSQQSFETFLQQMTLPLHQLLLWGFLTALVYHLLAGIRHIMMDMGFGESVKAGRVTAWMTILLSLIISLGLGAWLCL